MDTPPKTTPAFIIRPAVAEDLEALVRLLQQLFEIEADFTFCERRQRQGLTMLMARRQACVLVAEVGRKVRGMCTIQLVVSTAEGGFSGWIEDLVIHRCWRRIGLGQHLFQAACEWGAAHGASRVQLLVDRDNQPALEFYRTMGCDPTQLTAWRHRSPSGRL